MHSNDFDILHLLECCLITEDTNSKAWQEFIKRYQSFIQKVAYKTLNIENPNEFTLWFITYLFQDQKRLNSAYESTLKKTKNQDLETLEQQEKYFKNYLAKIIKTNAKEKYLKEIQSETKSLDDKPNKESNKTYHEIIEDKRPSSLEAKCQNITIDNIAKYIDKLEFKQSVPLILKSKTLYSIIKLSDEQLKWINERSGMSVQEVEETIEKEFWENLDEKLDINNEKQTKYPLSSKFIGEILGLSPANVDQIAKRTLAKLKSERPFEKL